MKDSAFYPAGSKITYELAAKGSRGPVVELIMRLDKLKLTLLALFIFISDNGDAYERESFGQAQAVNGHRMISWRSRVCFRS